MTGKKVIFIGGSSYSGSTMLDMMLANSQEGFSAGEVHALFRPYRPHHFNPVCGCGDANCLFWDQVRQPGEKLLYETIFNLLPKVLYIVDSSKNPWWILRQERMLKSKGFLTHNLLIWKEPDAFAHSMLKRQRKGWLKAWKNYYRIYLSLIDDYIPVPYNELVHNPELFLRKLCDRLDIPFNDNQQNFWGKRHHTLFGNRSAKVHLQKDYDLGNSLLVHDDDQKEKHRSIYCDVEYRKSLPADVKNHLSSDLEIKNIVRALEKGIPISTPAHLGRFFLATAKAKYQLKHTLGSLLGKHVRIV